jgi:hypothetical protein
MARSQVFASYYTYTTAWKVRNSFSLFRLFFRIRTSTMFNRNDGQPDEKTSDIRLKLYFAVYISLTNLAETSFGLFEPYRL